MQLNVQFRQPHCYSLAWYTQWTLANSLIFLVAIFVVLLPIRYDNYQFRKKLDTYVCPASKCV